jgi:hypothetical protein
MDEMMVFVASVRSGGGDKTWYAIDGGTHPCMQYVRLPVTVTRTLVTKW